VRVICAEGSFEIEEADITVHKDESEYNIIRHINALVEGSKECGGHFPLHLNFNQLHGVSTTKGCYIGQELVQRTTHIGTVRKQTLPFVLRTPKLQDKLQIDPDNFNALRFIDRDYIPSKPMQGMDIKD
jgi:folate-binding protein YgfZ